MVAFFLKSRSI